MERRSNLAIWGESTESVVQGVCTKDHEIKLDKYRESGSLIEKGCTTDTIDTDDSVPMARPVCGRLLRFILFFLFPYFLGNNDSPFAIERAHTFRVVGTPT
jgi:hypothetical protein